MPLRLHVLGHFARTDTVSRVEAWLVVTARHILALVLVLAPDPV
jgi:hypothetical protein